MENKRHLQFRKHYLTASPAWSGLLNINDKRTEPM